MELSPEVEEVEELPNMNVIPGETGMTGVTVQLLNDGVFSCYVQ